MKLYVGNVSFTMTDAELKAAFEEFGKVAVAEIVCDWTTGANRGFGFVIMPNEDEARRAMTALDGTEYKGRALRVSRAFNDSRRGVGR